ncbi:hypothetical protein H6F76_18170 [Leptolyngbya sp. FACHB-321]|uniref:hypothetical protein n=1 Tax=Leptolyngbya sp. FACHB-321 TaxID=2692807 RepID=UPI00168948A3|nr:hypothetical protein [Leptolyngbya sp. FACHB-321]MBD2036937.1 hypothetical protein [Leptolyngbya sp. FACHB-321]
MNSKRRERSEPEVARESTKGASETQLAASSTTTKDDRPLAVRSPSLMRSVVSTVAGFGAAVSSKASQTGQALVKTSANLGGTIGRTASQTSRSAWKVATGFSNVVFKQGHHWAEQATAGTDQAVTYVSDNPMIRRLTKALKLDWLVSISDQVDLAKAEAAVHKLQQAHPNEAPSQIAHRIMLEKAVYAGSVGLASSLVPGGAIALLAVDLATTSKLQTEMLYQIAAAYGLTLNDPARKRPVAFTKPSLIRKSPRLQQRHCRTLSRRATVI